MTTMNDAQAVFLVGGFGTRLGELTRHTPKPLMPVAGRPFLAWLAEAVARQGVRDMLFLSGYLAPQIEAAMASLEQDGVRVRCSVEPEPLGTGGALAYARADLAADFFLLNGDSLFDVPLAELARPAAGPPPLGRLALRREADPARYGSVTLEGERIVGFVEKTAAAGREGLINGGVYWLRREVLDGAPQGAFSLERDLFPQLAARGELAGRVFEGAFIDIGVPESLQAAQTVVPAALSPPPG